MSICRVNNILIGPRVSRTTFMKFDISQSKIKSKNAKKLLFKSSYIFRILGFPKKPI